MKGGANYRGRELGGEETAGGALVTWIKMPQAAWLQNTMALGPKGEGRWLR